MNGDNFKSLLKTTMERRLYIAQTTGYRLGFIYAHYSCNISLVAKGSPRTDHLDAAETQAHSTIAFIPAVDVAGIINLHDKGGKW